LNHSIASAKRSVEKVLNLVRVLRGRGTSDGSIQHLESVCGKLDYIASEF